MLPITFVSGLDANTWSPRAAILLVVAAVGLPVLLSQTRQQQSLAARAAMAFVAVGAASAVFSQNHTTAVFGLYNQGTGLLFMAALAGAWAIGRTLRPEARPLLERALLIGVFINIAMALLASVVDLNGFGLNLVDAGGRASGLTGNPIHLAALAILGVALSVPRLAASPVTWAPPMAAAAMAAQLSGTRGALVIMAGIAVWAGRRHGLRIAALLALLLFLGLAAGTAIGTSSTSSATSRAGNLGDWKTRPVSWLSARHSVIQHPLLGVGPGQFRTATSPYRPVSVGLAEGPERLATDAHNIFVEYATTTGLLGLGALLVWLIAAARSARGWLLVGAIGVFAIHLFEPQSVVTTPLAFLALGASSSFGAIRDRPSRTARQLVLPLCCIGVAMVAGSVLLFGELEMHQAELDLRTPPAQRANSILPAWPSTASMLARVWLFHGITNGHNPADYQVSRSWRLTAVQRDNTDPALWNDLAELDESIGRRQDARAEYASALRLNPTSVRAMNGLARSAHSRCDTTQEQYWRQQARRFAPVGPASSPSPATCPPPARP